jgi:hypothetical protein
MPSSVSVPEQFQSHMDSGFCSEWRQILTYLGDADAWRSVLALTLSLHTVTCTRSHRRATGRRTKCRWSEVFPSLPVKGEPHSSLNFQAHSSLKLNLFRSRRCARSFSHDVKQCTIAPEYFRQFSQELELSVAGLRP